MYQFTDQQASDIYTLGIQIFNSAKNAEKYGAQKETMPEIFKKAKELVSLLQEMKVVDE